MKCTIHGCVFLQQFETLQIKLKLILAPSPWALPQATSLSRRMTAISLTHVLHSPPMYVQHMHVNIYVHVYVCFHTAQWLVGVESGRFVSSLLILLTTI